MGGIVICLGYRRPEVVSAATALGYEVLLVHNGEYSGNLKSAIKVDLEAVMTNDFDLPQLYELREEEVRGILVPFEAFVEYGAELKERFFPSIVGLDRQQALIVRDKLRMKEFLSTNGIPTVRFSALTLGSTYESLVASVGSHFLVKPRKWFLAKGIRLIRSKGDWINFLAQTVNPEEYLAEEYLEPVREFCCDTIAIDGEIVIQFTGEYTVSCLESSRLHEGFGVNYPGFLSSDEIQQMRAIARKFVEASGIASNVFHIELLLHKGRWVFSEVGARIPGGHQFPTESLIAGIDLHELYVRMMTRSCDENATRALKEVNTAQRYFGYYLYPKKAGRIREVTTDLNRSWIVSSDILVHKGDEISFEDSSIAKSACVVYQASSSSELQRYSEEVKELIKLSYE